MSTIEAVISDFGGVLTSPLFHAFAAYQEEEGVPLETLGTALARVAETDGANPLFELECGRMTEAAFLARLATQIYDDVGRTIELHSFPERYFAHLHPNEPMIAYLAGLRERGYRMAMLTNNVREWEPRWRAMLPVEEIFELVVDSAFVDMRKPDPRIYELTCERLGVDARRCVFIDDVDVNIVAARELGMTAVHFRDAEQAIAEVAAALEASGDPARD